MTDDEDAINQINALDADDRAVAIHEAGHTVVAHVLGAEVLFVEIYISSPSPDDGKKGGGKTGLREEMTDKIKNLAVSVAGRKAEHAFAALALRSSGTEERSRHDLQQMENLLLHFPEAERCAARAASYRLAAENLTANADVVHRIADELLSREHIEGEELAALLAGAEPA